MKFLLTITMILFLQMNSFFECKYPLVQELEEAKEIPLANVLLPNGGCPDSLEPVYLELDGLINIEVESANYEGTSWKLDSLLSGYSGNGYLVWRGSDNFNKPGIDVLSYKIRISTPGTYRFTWNSRITEGDSSTDFNDSWFRIPDANHFYGRKENGHIVYPKGSNQAPIAESSNQSDTNPNGAGSDGWFKVYMNTKNKWLWRTTTSDNDPHFIFAVFSKPGDYTIQISGRSKSHGIDKFVLFLNGINNEETTGNKKWSEVKCE